MVSMIPFGLLAGFAGEKEVRIIGLDESGFEFRVRKGTLLNEGKFTLYFWNIETAEYDEINIYEYELKLSKEMLSKEKNMDASSRDARLVKSILLNSAKKLDSWDNGTQIRNSVSVNGKVFNGVFTTERALDYYSGAGALDAEQALAEYDKFGSTSFLEEVAKSDSSFYYFESAADNAVLNATLCWFAGSEVENVIYDSSLNISSIDASSSYFANLDLRLWYQNDGGELQLIAQSISEYNNVEHLYLNLDKSGNYALEVFFKDLIYGDTAKETYALAWNLAQSQIPEPSCVAILAAISAIACIAARRRKNPAA